MQLVGILFSNKLTGSTHLNGHCPTGLFYQILLDTFPVFIMVAVFETVVYPFFKVLVPSMLRRIGLGMGVAILGLLVLLVLDVYGYKQLLNSELVEVVLGSSHSSNSSNGSVVELSCYLVNGSVEEQVGISVHAISSVMLLGALAETLIFIAGT